MSSPLSAFTAVPNPQMLAFMGAQSYLMMYMAGAGWQYGKRKISAMSNETFNPLTVTSLYKQMTTELKESIPTIEKSMNDMTDLLAPIIEQYGDFIREAIAAGPQTVKNIVAPESLAGQVVHAPEGQDWTQSLSNFLNVLTGQLPSLPKIEARLGPGISKQAIQSVETDNAAAERLAKHTAFIQQQRSTQALAKTISPSRNIPGVHQIALQADRGTSVIRKAGQTQIQARLRLLREIAAAEKLRKIHYANRWLSIGANGKMLEALKLRQNKQTELAGLLKRYRF